MRDRHFREDENELPYLVRQTRNDERRGYSDRPESSHLHIYDVPFSQFPLYIDRLGLAPNQKSHLINSIEIRPRDCTFSIHRTDDLRLSFKVKNEYLTTEIMVRYDPASGQLEYLTGTTHHDALQSQQWFKDIVHKIEIEKGCKFEFCYRGHDFKCRDGKLVINDDFETMVMFEKDGCNDHYGYRLDFSRRKLEFYHEYPFHEYYDFFL